MTQKTETPNVIPFFKIKGSKLMLKPEHSITTQKVWLEKEKLMLAILDSLAEGVFTIDFDMKVTVFNKAAERITGFTAEEAFGRSCMDVFCNQGENLQTGKVRRRGSFTYKRLNCT